MSLVPMLATEVPVARLLDYSGDDQFVFEEKLNGHRILLFVEGRAAVALGRNGQVSQHNSRFRTPSLMAFEIERIPYDVILDGELVENIFHVFDMPQGPRVTPESPFYVRRKALEDLFASWNPARITLVDQAVDTEAKLKLAISCINSKAEGIMAKTRKGKYRSGQRCLDVQKCKFTREVDAIVTGLKFQGKDNAVLSLIKDGDLVEVGRASTIGKPLLDLGDIVEVRYLYLGANGRLVQPRILQKRDDKDARECTYDQLSDLKLTSSVK